MAHDISDGPEYSGPAAPPEKDLNFWLQPDVLIRPPVEPTDNACCRRSLGGDHNHPRYNLANGKPYCLRCIIEFADEWFEEYGEPFVVDDAEENPRWENLR
jgi:hypothetical protein